MKKALPFILAVLAAAYLIGCSAEGGATDQTVNKAAKKGMTDEERAQKKG